MSDEHKQQNLLKKLDKMTDLIANKDWPALAVEARRFAYVTRLTKKGRPKANRGELRRKIKLAIEKGVKKSRIAKHLGISRQTLYNILGAKKK